MKNWILSLAALCFTYLGAAQKHFLYLQSESNLPFYAKMGDRIFSSAFSGYLIISNLPDSSHLVSIGFAGKPGESRFSIEMKGKDRGLLLKEVDGVLNLFDLQTLTLIKPLSDRTSSKYSYNRREDAFTRLLAKASNDTSLLYVRVEMEQPKLAEVKAAEAKAVIAASLPVQRQEEGTTSTATAAENKAEHSGELTQELAKNDSNLAAAEKETVSENPVIVQPKQQTAAAETTAAEVITKEVEEITDLEFRPSTVVRRSESSTSEGFGLVFWDRQGSQTDTIRILIPNPRMVYQNVSSEAAEKTPKKFLDISDTVVAVSLNTQAPAVLQPSCTVHAENKDFLALRKSMAAQETEQEMIETAKERFAEKCFSTEQLKHLSKLFLSEETKLQFFEAAYRFVSDKDRFSSLQSELRDVLLLKRFNALSDQ